MKNTHRPPHLIFDRKKDEKIDKNRIVVKSNDKKRLDLATSHFFTLQRAILKYIV